jgi:hypothetical protein
MSPVVREVRCTGRPGAGCGIARLARAAKVFSDTAKLLRTQSALIHSLTAG